MGQLQAVSGSGSAGNGKPAASRLFGRSEYSRLNRRESVRCQLGWRGRLVQSMVRQRCAGAMGGQEKRSRRPGPSASEKDTTCELIQGSGRRQSHPQSQRLHSTLVVAGADIPWHASAHKRNPLFRRWAPALNTVRPEGSPGASFSYRDKTPGDPSSRHSADKAIRVYGRRISRPSCRPSDMLATGTCCRRRKRAGFPAGARGRIDRGRYVGRTNR